MPYPYLKNNVWLNLSPTFVVLLGLTLVTSVQAEETADIKADERWSIYGTLSSDDIEHGFSRTLGDPGVQAAMIYRDPSGWGGGFRAKTIDFVANGLADRDLFVSLRGFIGYEWQLDDQWQARVSGHYLNFPGSTAESSSYEELYAEVLYAELLRFRIDYGHNRYTLKEDSVAYELTGHYPIGLGYTLDGMFGFHDAEKLLGDSYSYHSVGVSKRFGPFAISLMYHETSQRGDELFDSIGEMNGLDLTKVTDPGFVLSFSSRSDVFERTEWQRWDGYKNFSSSIDIVSNYVSKGVSQTEDNPAVQLSVDYGWNSGVYTGIWVSNVDYVPRGQDEDGADFEVDLYLGYSFELFEGLSLDASYVYYDYPGIEDALENDFDYGEFILGASYGHFGAKIGYSNDQVASGEKGTWYQGTADYELIEKLSLNLQVGHYDRSNFGHSYNWWGAGLAYDMGKFNLGLAVTQTSSAAKLDNTDGQADNHIIANVSYSF